MRIHSDVLTSEDLYRELPDGCYLEASTHGSRKRRQAFEVKIEAKPGVDAHGIKRCYAQNSGTYGASQDGYTRAATWIEWGDWMVALFKIDPSAIIGYYDGASDFVRQTHYAAPHRPDRENAEQHADRWSADLFYSSTPA